MPNYNAHSGVEENTYREMIECQKQKKGKL